jgi:anti-anti-sigma factor
MLRAAFESVFSDGDAEMIVIDLTELEFMDSSGIGLLLEMDAVCSHADRLRILNGTPAIVRVLDVSGVRARLPIISSTDDPLTPLRRPQRPPNTSQRE